MSITETDIALTGLVLGAVGTAITLIWRFFGLTKQIDMKAEKQDIHTISEELVELRHKYDMLESVLRDKADANSLELLKKDLSYIKEQMISKSDLLNFRNDIINALRKEKDE